MVLSARIVSREIGTALAVLAIYVLTLLLPLHQAAASQRDFNDIGYWTASSWSVCAQLAEDEQGGPREAAALSCPAVGVAKHQVALPLPTAPLFVPVRAAEPVAYPLLPGILAATTPDHVGQSRAPPATA